MKNYTISEEDALKLFQAIEITKQGLEWSDHLTAIQAATALVYLQDIKDSLSKQMLDYSVAKNEVTVKDVERFLNPAPVKKKTPVKRTKKTV